MMNVCSTIIENPRLPVSLVLSENEVKAVASAEGASGGTATLPPIYPEWLGDRAFSATHGARFNYVVGEMARGIATPRMVVEAVRAGCLGFYGSAGLSLDEIERGLREIKAGLSDAQNSWGANLIHTPQQPGYEADVVDLFLREGVRRVSASAYMRLSPEIVRYTALGLQSGPNGAIIRTNHVFAKVSRAEIAEQFLAPAPEAILNALVVSGAISAEQAQMAAQVPVAAEITAEADSGGHTDRRAAAPLFTSICAARDRIASKTGIDPDTIRIGLAGGIATPHAVAAAFSMGAAYVLTGSINQAAVESGLSLPGRQLLAKASPADVAMAPAADMFEQGVEVQVLKRGTLFAMRGKKLFQFYRSGAAFETLDPKDQAWVEDVLGEPFEAAWESTRDYIRTVNPKEAARAEADGNKRFALVARRYLFSGAQLAREGDPDRLADYQIWCGPAQGAFNEWVAGTFLEDISNRTVRQIAWNLMEGAARITRAAQLRAVGAAVPPTAFNFTPQQFVESEAA
ncbi:MULTISPECIES: PfaD family polyunsaturated fatty acid/polyketide biosynthesis protein [Hyphomonas]|uniref:2-nitropropane dioxygenase n=1 Tax=Hyphomonas adhaerens TaxID=81029 RepID=A0A3B9GZG2_9PROT|nr:MULTISPECIES: PfaD family polyunsaturated fatty acid/polyketide biosynthesis protein [Hyphomonas]MBB41041.1 2-nitropropane dioxygenase [Hyphomonas sp.]HAE27832.1 2-nitropropane dioxygenase [Hyphomonas adhaerens]|tara:strand:+ start:908 stop:2452 length:1545 start_codon:yes stop_codon:yes gene_type:complete